MKLFKVATLLTPLLMGVACESAKFSSGNLAPAHAVLPGPGGDAAKNLTGQVYAFGLKVGDGSPVVPQAITAVVPSVYLNGGTTALSGADLAAWQAAVYSDGATPGSFDAVKSTDIDLSKVSGSVTLHANFAQTTAKRTGTATQNVFVDGEAPKATLLRLSTSDGGDESQIFWSATDNYRVNEARSTLIGCSSVLADYTPKSYAEIGVLPASCVVVYQGDALHKLDSQIELKQLEIAGTTLLPAQVHYAIYIEDMVGLSTFAWMTEPVDGQALLSLATTPSKATFTNQRHVPIALQLGSLIGGVSSQIDAANNSSLWPAYDTAMTVTKPTPATATAAFKPNVTVDLPGADGLYSYDFQVSNPATGISSNHKTVVYILDTTPPAVSNVHINVIGGILNPQAMVDLNWSATDTNGIVSQTVEIMQTGDTTYTQVATIAGSQTTYSFPWGTRSDKGFVIRITANDPAANSGRGVSPKWTPQVFNAAVLTSSVQCYFCHVKIIGDLGGIGFPTDAAVRTDTGWNFKVTGKIYGTAGVPNKLGVNAVGGTVPNYDNSIYKIFPKNNVFPLITAAKLIDSVNGSLRLGTLTINRVYNGNLVLDGAQANQPIQLNGEVFINGDVVIRGKYTGVGTIYANNIYVVNDLIATNSPFPFADDPDAAKAQAVLAVANKTDGLYLGALNQVVVGALETSLIDENNLGLINTNPYGWISRPNYVALGQQAVPVKDSAGVERAINSGWIPNPADPAKLEANVEVNRVDAYIYAQVVLQWRAYANILLNGGFMSPRGGIVTTAPQQIVSDATANARTWANNPRNGLQPTQNVIRYDYRLRTGGSGFETIKSFFDQQ